MKKLLFLICILGVSISLQAQGKPSAWANLNNLHQGDRIQVRQMDSTKATGEFMSVSDAALSLQANGSAQVIARDTVKSVTLMKNKHRLRNSLLLAATGAGIGAGIGAAEHHGCSSTQTFCFDIGGKSLPAGIGAVIGFLGGGAIGAFLPSHEMIYRAN